MEITIKKELDFSEVQKVLDRLYCNLNKHYNLRGINDIISLQTFPCRRQVKYNDTIVFESRPNEKPFKRMARFLCHLKELYPKADFTKQKELLQIAKKKYDSIKGAPATYLKGELAVSNNLIDYLTMSYNTHNWRSCLSADGGEYKAGALELANASNVRIAYLYDGEFAIEECASIPELGIYKGMLATNKLWRTILVCDKENGVLAAIKQYPFASDELLRAALNLCAQQENIDITNKKIVNLSNLGFTFSCQLMYNDTAVGNDVYGYVLGEHTNIIYGNGATCPSCGRPLEDPSEYYCADCLGYHYCAQCGELLYEGEGIQSEDGEWYCEKHYTQCECCEQELNIDYGEYYFISNDVVYCRNCLQQAIENDEIIENEWGEYEWK